ncbi:membrane protease subunit HflK [Novosphingobium kunmingense]|uniref:Membrane protease subunit HflK n=1 Tax=Novosphingobium kunmingense TaxID=1211806 RepID=A0A2N0HK78_9SPHN|nr:protease modulator HflK [Novosphingobium kunmingense]PKB19351.1 membrane protease subunit HflK [Novosphingobium kunmingense]
MDKPGENDRVRALAMAKPKSPWGDGGDAAEAETPDATGESGEPAAEPGAEPTTKGTSRPLNPWLPPAEDEAKRRSAHIDDILKQRARLVGGAPSGRNWIPFVVAGLVALWAGGTSVHALGKGEQGLVTTFGRYDRTVGPGLTLTLPWPAQAVAVRETGTPQETVVAAKSGENLMITRDRQLVNLSAKLRWTITDLPRFAYNSDDTPALVARLAEAQVRAAVAEQTFDDLIEGQRRPELQQLVATRTQAALDALKLGVRVEGAEVLNANPPERLADAFRKVNEARKGARDAIANASGEAQRIIAVANDEAARFESVYAQYQAAPEITRKRAYYQTMERILAENNVVIAGSGATVTVNPGSDPVVTPTPTSAPSAAATGGE